VNLFSRFHIDCPCRNRTSNASLSDDPGGDVMNLEGFLTINMLFFLHSTHDGADLDLRTANIVGFIAYLS